MLYEVITIDDLPQAVRAQPAARGARHQQHVADDRAAARRLVERFEARGVSLRSTAGSPIARESYNFV